MLVLTHGLMPALLGSPAASKLSVPLQRSALRYLDRAVVFSTNEAFKIFALEKVISLLDKYIAMLEVEPAPGSGPAVAAASSGGSPQVFIEYLLRVILDVITFANGKYKPLAVETLLVQNTRAKLIAFYKLTLTTNQPTVSTKEPTKKATTASKVAHTKTWFGSFNTLAAKFAAKLLDSRESAYHWNPTAFDYSHEHRFTGVGQLSRRQRTRIA